MHLTKNSDKSDLVANVLPLYFGQTKFGEQHCDLADSLKDICTHDLLFIITQNRSPGS
jgi:hypothetical protein